MSSESKKRKLRDVYGCPGILKHKEDKGPKRLAFYASSLKKLLNRIKIEEV